MSINEAVKNALARLRQTNEPITPENYRQVFCAEAKKLGLNPPDCRFVERALEKLSIPLRRLADAYRIRTPDELAIFLTSQLNRAASANKTDATQTAAIVMRRLLSIVEALPIPRLSAEAKFSLGRDLTHLLILQDEQKRWTQLEESLDLSEFETCANLAPIAKIFARALRQAVGESAFDRADRLAEEIMRDPSLLTAPAALEEAEELLEHEPFEAIDERARRLDEMTRQLHEILNAQSKESGELESEIGAAEGGESELWQSLKSRFVEFGKSLRTRAGTIGELENKIAALESELEKTRAESRMDAATNAPNRRAINDALEAYETAFATYRKDYAIAFFEIDAFDMLLGDLGVGSSEAVLGVVAKYLGRALPPKSAYGHYMAHAFMAVFNAGGDDYAGGALENLVRQMAVKRFVYGSRSFFVTLSAGWAIRSKCKSERDAINAADAGLRAAKLAGGNAARSAAL